MSKLFGLCLAVVSKCTSIQIYCRATDIKCLDFATIVADRLQNLLDFCHEAIMIYWSCKLDGTKVARAFSHVLFTSTASEIAIDCSEMRIIRTFFARSEALLIPGNQRLETSNHDGMCLSILYIHRLRIFDVDDRKAFGFFGREQAKLDLLDRAQRRARVGKIETRHDCSCILGRR